jgi:diacylglycerol kinase (ATP)
MKVSLIANPVSGNKSGHLKRLKALETRFASFPGLDYRILETSGPGHATLLAEESALRGDRICFALGGDGTMNEVGCGLMGSETALGILPAGSGNGLARHLKIPLNPEQAAVSLIHGKTEASDVGIINQIPFFLAAGIGFEGVVAARFATRKRRGFLSYILSAAEEYLRWQPIGYTARFGRESISGKAFTIDFANGSQYGNNAIIAPGASVNDGLLQFVRVLPFPARSAPAMLRKLMNGRINRSAYHLERAFSRLELSVEDRDAIEGHVDGEPLRFQLPLLVEVQRGGILIRLPA